MLACAAPAAAGEPLRVSGRYPHLAMYNTEGECGVGAVVPWAGRLWVMTYSPHKPHGSDDKLYEIDAQLNRAVRPESVGGTPAGRMIHRESNQLVMGPYFIDAQGNVRAISPEKMPGRLTAVARHLTDPANKVYVYDMEGALYEVDVHSLAVKRLYKKPFPGWHGKGGYTSQGRLVLANNGEAAAGKIDPNALQVAWPAKSPEDAGALAQWDGDSWRLVARWQFTEVTGPGGILGAPSDDSPLWAVGWDKRSLILKLLDDGQWYTYRLPKADRSYDARHGWYTEWPRIREVVPAQGGQPPKLLMNMHGGWFDFPKHFRGGHAAGLRPLGSYLKITADFAPWRGEIVFACDDTATIGNKLAGQSHSNLWFATWDELKTKGRPVGWGGPWLRDAVEADVPSDPYLFAGYEPRVLHLTHGSGHAVTFRVEIDRDGAGRWETYRKIEVPPRGYVFHIFPNDAKGEWIRLVAEQDADDATAYFHYGISGGAETDRAMFASLADIDAPGPRSAGLLRPRGGNLGTLQFLATEVSADGATTTEYFEMDADLNLVALPEKTDERNYIVEHAAIGPPDFTVDAASVVITDARGKRYRLPKTNPAYDAEWKEGPRRAVREVVTERNLLNAHGTFYMLPRPSAGGVARIKPICTHGKRITDFCSWRGLLVLAGNRSGGVSPPETPKTSTAAESHRYESQNGRAGLWLGDIDDLWRLGKPRGHGGPWRATDVKAGEPSDPYLMNGYARKRVALSHGAPHAVAMTIEVDITGDGLWRPYKTFRVPAGETVEHVFPAGFAASWVRLRADRDCQSATAEFVYE